MTDLERVSEIVSRFMRVRPHGRFAVVPTFSFYPSNAMVKAYVEGEGESFVVSDGGGAIDTLHGAGGYSVEYARFIGSIAKRRRFKLSSEGWLVSPKVDGDGLTGAITETVELSKTCAEILLRHFHVHEAIDFRSALDRQLEGRFHSAVHKKVHLAGASNKAHTFDYLIKLPSKRALVIDTVVPEASSVNAALVSHLDLKNAGRDDIRQAIVFDDRVPWKSSDLALLKIAAPPIAYTRFEEQLEDLAA
ncbi:hypothetical protein [Bradyrhizobium neotropicale]|uniref:hypothetical protein n=1 Tax=Bradyrhizobium neotropicale TaxID=1497615 RepID=UPI001AD775D7|nr:hypothetical protein [Bradyrhizobium neotropicale]MBO4227221.1 hypothetical protein [Bradyrhizobium neotropicale]